MRFYTTEKLGPNREKTPDKFLLCRNVPIARTGIQLYGPGEVPITSSSDGMVRVHRKPEDVFHEASIRSFHGKPLTIDHPDEDVTPENWNRLAKGIIFDPRRGEGVEDDLLLADILVCDAEAIRLIEDEGIEEVSGGYDARYVEDEFNDGEGYQTNIVANHVALVERGRCGPRCHIRDGGVLMRTMESVIQGIRDAFKSKDETKLDAALKGLDAAPAAIKDEDGTHIHIHTQDGEKETDDAEGGRLGALDRTMKDVLDRLTAMEDKAKARDKKDEEDEDEDEDEDDDEKKKAKDAASSKAAADKAVADKAAADKAAADAKEKETEDGAVADETSDGLSKDEVHSVGDSRYMEESVQATMAAAEIMVPGIQYPTFDRMTKPVDTVKALDALRKKALGIYASTIEGATTLTELRGGKVLTQDALAALPTKETRTLFFSASTHVKERNRAHSRSSFATDATPATPQRPTLADMNRINQEFWKQHIN